MAAGPFDVYEKGVLSLLNGAVDFESDTIKMALLLHGHTVDLAADEFLADVNADECADGDYAVQTLASKTLAIVSNKPRFDCADIDFGNAVTIAARYALIYKDTGAAATSNLLWISDLNTSGANLSSTAADFDVAIGANGIYEITPNA